MSRSRSRCRILPGKNRWRVQGAGGEIVTKFVTIVAQVSNLRGANKESSQLTPILCRNKYTNGNLEHEGYEEERQ